MSDMKPPTEYMPLIRDSRQYTGRTKIDLVQTELRAVGKAYIQIVSIAFTSQQRVSSHRPDAIGTNHQVKSLNSPIRKNNVYPFCITFKFSDVNGPRRHYVAIIDFISQRIPQRLPGNTYHSLTFAGPIRRWRAAPRPLAFEGAKRPPLRSLHLHTAAREAASAHTLVHPDALASQHLHTIGRDAKASAYNGWLRLLGRLSRAIRLIDNGVRAAVGAWSPIRFQDGDAVRRERSGRGRQAGFQERVDGETAYTTTDDGYLHDETRETLSYKKGFQFTGRWV